jgi:cell division septation protein DedD
MNSAKRKAIAAIAAIALGATFLPLMFTSPASGATNNGTATLTQSSGTGATNFTINLGGSASCPGDGNAGYRWQTFMIPAAADIDATLTFGSSGPTAVGSEFRQPLFDISGSPVVAKLPDIAVAPATTGGISGIPNFNFEVFSPTNIPNGAYNIGVACTLGAAGATQLKSYWSQQITITNDPTNQDNAKVDWATSTPVSTTTTTAAPTTTTTADPTTTTSTTTVGQSTPTTTTDPLAGDGSTTDTGEPTDTLTSSSGGGLPMTGSGVWSILFWAVVLLVAGRMMYLVSRSPKPTEEVE